MAGPRLTYLATSAIVFELGRRDDRGCRNGNDGRTPSAGNSPAVAETAGASVASAVGLRGVVAVAVTVEVAGGVSATH